MDLKHAIYVAEYWTAVSTRGCSAAGIAGKHDKTCLCFLLLLLGVIPHDYGIYNKLLPPITINFNFTTSKKYGLSEKSAGIIKHWQCFGLTLKLH